MAMPNQPMPTGGQAVGSYVDIVGTTGPGGERAICYIPRLTGTPNYQPRLCVVPHGYVKASDDSYNGVYYFWDPNQATSWDMVAIAMTGRVVLGTVMGGNATFGNDSMLTAVQNCWNWAISKYNVRTDKIDLFGGSMGGLGTLVYMNKHPTTVNAACIQIPLVDQIDFHDQNRIVGVGGVGVTDQNSAYGDAGGTAWKTAMISDGRNPWHQSTNSTDATTYPGTGGSFGFAPVLGATYKIPLLIQFSPQDQVIPPATVHAFVDQYTSGGGVAAQTSADPTNWFGGSFYTSSTPGSIIYSGGGGGWAKVSNIGLQPQSNFFPGQPATGHDVRGNLFSYPSGHSIQDIYDFFKARP